MKNRQTNKEMKMELKKVSELIERASLDDLEVIASAVQARRDQLAKSKAYKVKRLRKAKKATGHGQAIVTRLFG